MSLLLLVILRCHGDSILSSLSSFKLGDFITSLEVVTGNSSSVECPESYEKKDTNLNSGVPNSAFVYVCIRRNFPWQFPLSSIAVISLTSPNPRNEDCFGSKLHSVVPINLNQGTGSDTFIYFCISRAFVFGIISIDFLKSESPITDLSTAYPKGTCERQNLNEGAGGDFIYFCYRKLNHLLLT